MTVSLFNYLGYDDKNLLLFFTCPPLMVLEDFSPILRRYFSENVLFIVLYLINILFWFLVGLCFDWTIKRVRAKMSIKKWTRITRTLRNLLITLFLILGLTAFQYLRPTISQDKAVAIATNYLGNKSSKIGTTILTDNFLDVITGNRYWLIGNKDTFIRINAYSGKIIKEEKQ